MTINRREFLAATSLGGLTLSLPALAQVAGKDYTLVQPAQPTDNPGKIEILEFFSYGCPHCHEFHPLLAAWAAKQQGDVVLRKVPITFGRAAWANIAKLFYALEATGDLARLEGDVFNAIHRDRVMLFEDKTIQEWVAAKGVDMKKFTENYGSFTTQSKLRRGDQLAQAYRISGVPSVAVDGRFLVGGKDFNEILANADKLIAKVRSEKPGKK